MAISPAQVEIEATELGRLYAEIETELLALIAARLAQGIDAPSWAEVQLAGVRAVRQVLQAEIARLDAAGSDRLGTLVTRAYLAGIDGALADMEGIVERPSLVRPHITAAQAFVREAELRLRSTHLAILRQMEDAFRQAVAEGTRAAIGGAETRKQASQRILNNLADKGITGFVDRAGRRWSLDSYAEMAARTAMGRAGVQAFVDTMAANGQDLVICSDVPEECDLCRIWEGRVLSVSGAIRGTVTMGGGVQVRIAGSVAEATAAGLFHPNCRHRLTMFVPGHTRRFSETADPDGYEDRQHQRYLERGIRRWKRREAAAMDDAAKAEARAKVREWQRRTREFVAEKDRKRLYYREQIRS